MADKGVNSVGWGLGVIVGALGCYGLSGLWASLVFIGASFVFKAGMNPNG